MNKTAIIIPSRLDAIRLPNKPLKLINNKEMILHVYEAAMKANAGEVYVATPDKKIIDTVKKIGFSKTSNQSDADCYLINTCHIRDKAKEKVYHEVGRVKKIFRDKKKPILVVLVFSYL